MAAAIALSVLGVLGLDAASRATRGEVVEEPMAAAPFVPEDPVVASEAERRQQKQKELEKQIAMLESGQLDQPRAKKPAASPYADADADANYNDGKADRSLKPTATAKSARELTVQQQGALREARARVSIRVYSTSWCPACKSTRSYFNARGIRYQEFDVEQSPTARVMQERINPKGSVPTIEIDGQVLIGFSAQDIEQAIDHAAHKRAGS